ncbi:ATP-dependent protease La [Purpureocillium lavendulum]|uniref:ATP-dependent protease La n=1 Tax=Purpureocillium lavendulum TaxID=1247861 RepID=A0AB34G6S0_9HYPO|nr:ATP-dependent protease La [Purpureocillium lavendulum]
MSSFNLHLGLRFLFHQLQMRHRRAFVRIFPVRLLDESISGRSLDETDANLRADLTQADDVLCLEIVVLENDFEDGAMLGNGRVDLANLIRDVIPIVPQRLSNVNDHVDFFAPGSGGGIGFVNLDLGGTVSVREANDRANENICTIELSFRHGNCIGFDASCGDIVFFGDAEAFEDVGVRHCGVKKRMVDHLGDLAKAHCDCTVGRGHLVAVFCSFTTRCGKLGRIIGARAESSYLIKELVKEFMRQEE